jgi:hypothetical protein
LGRARPPRAREIGVFDSEQAAIAAIDSGEAKSCPPAAAPAQHKRGSLKKKKTLSAVERWMLKHPGDAECPRDPSAATAWRRKRGLARNAADVLIRKKYEQAMAEKRAP